MTIHVNQSHHCDTPITVNVYPHRDDDYAVQVFLGSSYDTLYMSVEDARQFAEQVRAALSIAEVVAS